MGKDTEKNNKVQTIRSEKTKKKEPTTGIEPATLSLEG